MTTIDGFDIKIDSHIPKDRAVKLNGTIYVTPAMFSLMQSAETESELRHLMANIRVVDMGEFDFLAGVQFT